MGNTPKAIIRIGILMDIDKLPWVMKDCKDYEKWYYFSHLGADPSLNTNNIFEKGEYKPGKTSEDYDIIYEAFKKYKEEHPIPFEVQLTNSYDYSEKVVICLPEPYICADGDPKELTVVALMSLTNYTIPADFAKSVIEIFGKTPEDIKVWLIPLYG